MKLKNLGANKTQLTMTEGTVIFFSYQTPVAALLPSGQYVRTAKKWSVTTSKHINQWLGPFKDNAITQPQEFFDNIAESA